MKPVIVDTDAHYCEAVGTVPLSEKLIEECGFPKKLVFNADADRVIDYIEKKRSISLR